MKTLSASPVDPDEPGGAWDLGGQVVDGIESLRQRVVTRLRFGRGEWFANPGAGTQRVIGNQIPAVLAAAALTDAIRDEGGDEIVSVTVDQVSLAPATRALTYRATVESVYGAFRVDEQVV